MFELDMATSRTDSGWRAGNLGGSALAHAGLLAGVALLAALRIPEISAPFIRIQEFDRPKPPVVVDISEAAAEETGGPDKSGEGEREVFVPPPPPVKGKGKEPEGAFPPGQPETDPAKEEGPPPDSTTFPEGDPSGDPAGNPEGEPSGSRDGIPGGTGDPYGTGGPGTGGQGGRDDGTGDYGANRRGEIQDGSVFVPRLLRKVEPLYPVVPARARIEGDVILEVVVGADGSPARIDILKSDRLFDASAIDAVRQWRWTPAMMGGRPVAVYIRIEVSFRLR